jgi:hypothetical protein
MPPCSCARKSGLLMPDLTPLPRNLLRQNLSLQPGYVPSRLEAIALSDDSYFQKVRKYAVLQIREDLLKDFIYSAIIGPGISGLIALLNGEVTVTTLVWAIVGLCVTFFVLFIKHVIQAPAQIDNILRTQLAQRQAELLAERAQNAVPQLTGEIICLEDDARLDKIDRDYDCFITLCVKVRNSGTPTAVDTFSLNLWWDGVDHPGTSEPIDGYYQETWGRDPGDERSRHATRAKPLTEFPIGEEITTTSKTGWRRFSFGSLPPEMIEGGHRAVESGHLAKPVTVELVAHDSQGNPHTIYNETMYDGVRRLIGQPRKPAHNLQRNDV